MYLEDNGGRGENDVGCREEEKEVNGKEGRKKKKTNEDKIRQRGKKEKGEEEEMAKTGED